MLVVHLHICKSSCDIIGAGLATCMQHMGSARFSRYGITYVYQQYDRSGRGAPSLARPGSSSAFSDMRWIRAQWKPLPAC